MAIITGLAGWALGFYLAGAGMESPSAFWLIGFITGTAMTCILVVPREKNSGH